MTKLLTDTMLGRLTTYLRMCGYDTVYAQDVEVVEDDEIREFAERTGRTLLTRDHALAASTDDAIRLDSRTIDTMLETLSGAGFELTLPETPTHCSTCNGIVEGVAPDEETPEYAPDPVSVEMWQCTECGQFFWKGSHWENVGDTLASL
jgi:uncharacterized protein with PIN domain